MEYTLKYPVTDADGKEYSKLLFRRPTIKDMKAIDKLEGNIEIVAEMIERLVKGPDGSQMTSIAINKIDIEDFKAMAGIIESFLDLSPQTGEN